MVDDSLVALISFQVGFPVALHPLNPDTASVCLH